MKIHYKGKTYTANLAAIILGFLAFLICRAVYLEHSDRNHYIFLFFIISLILSGYIVASIAKKDSEFNSIIVGSLNGLLLFFHRLAWSPDALSAGFDKSGVYTFGFMILFAIAITYLGAAIRLRQLSKKIVDKSIERNL